MASSSTAAPRGPEAVRRVGSEEARTQFSELFSQVAYSQDRFIVTRHGKSVAAVIPVEEFRLLEALKRRIEDVADHRAVRVAREQQGKKGLASSAAVKEALGLG